jgi:hypothetical protein
VTGRPAPSGRPPPAGHISTAYAMGRRSLAWPSAAGSADRAAGEASASSKPARTPTSRPTAARRHKAAFRSLPPPSTGWPIRNQRQHRTHPTARALALRAPPHWPLSPSPSWRPSRPTTINASSPRWPARTGAPGCSPSASTGSSSPPRAPCSPDSARVGPPAGWPGPPCSPGSPHRWPPTSPPPSRPSSADSSPPGHPSPSCSPTSCSCNKSAPKRPDNDHRTKRPGPRPPPTQAPAANGTQTIRSSENKEETPWA